MIIIIIQKIKIVEKFSFWMKHLLYYKKKLSSNTEMTLHLFYWISETNREYSRHLLLTSKYGWKHENSILFRRKFKTRIFLLIISFTKFSTYGITFLLYIDIKNKMVAGLRSKIDENRHSFCLVVFHTPPTAITE